MLKLYLIPIISIFDVHDVAVKEWLSKLDNPAAHLEYPFKLERFFPESSRHALTSVEEVHSEILRLLDIINPQAVFLDISVDFIELENKYNKRQMTPLEFWTEYYQISASMEGSMQTVYCIYIKDIIDKKIRLIESRDHLPLSVVFYGLDVKTREELIPVYESILDRDGEFLLHVAKVINEITSLRESPKHLWYTPMQVRQTAVSYEETEKFYSELLNRLERMLGFKIRNYLVKSLREHALEFIKAYENFLEHKMKEDEIKFSNIIEGLKMLSSQSGYSTVAIFCGPMHYSALLNSLRKEKGLEADVEALNIESLLNRMKPFTQKNRIMQTDYEIALKILGLKKPERFDNPGAVLIPASHIPRST